MYCLTCCLKYVSFYPVVYLKYLPSENVQSEKRRGNLYLKNTFYRVIQITLSNIFKLFHPALTNPKISFLESYPRLWNSSFFLGGGRGGQGGYSMNVTLVERLDSGGLAPAAQGPDLRAVNFRFLTQVRSWLDSAQSAFTSTLLSWNPIKICHLWDDKN